MKTIEDAARNTSRIREKVLITTFAHPNRIYRYPIFCEEYFADFNEKAFGEITQDVSLMLSGIQQNKPFPRRGQSGRFFD